MPNDTTSAPGQLARKVDALCDQFEDGWRAGTPVPLEDFLANAADDVRPSLFRNALGIEQDYRLKAGQPLTPAEARDRFSGLGPWATAILDEVVPTETVLILDVIHGPYAGRSFSLTGHAMFTIGRQPGQNISLPDDPHLSRAHCLIEVNSPLARVVDLGSKTETIVNGRKTAKVGPVKIETVRPGKGKGMTVLELKSYEPGKSGDSPK